MTNRVPQTATPRNPIGYSARELSLMWTASSAYLEDRIPTLSADELAEAVRLLEGLPLGESIEDDEAPHDPGCGCWRCDDDPAYVNDDAPDAFEMSREMDALVGCP